MEFCAPCLFGIEGILGDELKRLGIDNVRVENGRVLFSGDAHTMARVNIGSRFAERVQIVVGSFRALTFEDLFQGTKNLPWESYIDKDDAFPVKGWSLDSQLHSVPDCQSIIKKAVVDRLSSAYHISWFSESGSKHQIQFTIHKDFVTVLLDTSGAGLHKRGYRANAVEAPMKETLAAAIADLARARNAACICDPCCGSGTLLIEAALSAKKIAPGIRRRFAAEEWQQIESSVWTEERERARSFELDDKIVHLKGADIDADALALTKENAAKAHVDTGLTVSRQDIADFVPEGDSGVVLCNPPYGARLLDQKAAEQIIKTMGSVFVPKTGWSYAIISPHEEFENLFGRKATKKRKLYNGMLKCNLFMYFGER